MTDKPASETPRTDAFVDLTLMGAKGTWRDIMDFARTLERALRAAERKLDVAESERVKYVEKYEYACQRERAAEQRAERLEGGNAQEAEQATAWVSVCDELSALGVPWHTGPHRSGLQGVLEELRSLVQRATQAEQSLAQERAARERAEGVIAAVRNLIGQVDYTRGMAGSDPSKGTGNYLADALDAYDQAIAQEGGKP